MKLMQLLGLLLTVDEPLGLALRFGSKLLDALWLLLCCSCLGQGLRSLSSRAALATRSSADDCFCLSVVRKRRRRFFDDALEYRIEVGCPNNSS